MKYALFGMPAIFIFYRMYEEGENFITFNELQRAYLDKKLVSSIEIQKSKGETIGIAFTKEGRKKFKIANLDFFLQQIDDY
jgi:ribosome biogenesis protein Nip4